MKITYYCDEYKYHKYNCNYIIHNLQTNHSIFFLISQRRNKESSRYAIARTKSMNIASKSDTSKFKRLTKEALYLV